MFRKEFLKDLNSLHLVNYGWYFDYPKENILASKFSLRDKIEPGFQEILQMFTSPQM
jgi:hypothetical protein